MEPRALTGSASAEGGAGLLGRRLRRGPLFAGPVPEPVLLLAVAAAALRSLVQAGGRRVAASLPDDLAFAVAILGGGRVCAGWRGCGRGWNSASFGVTGPPGDSEAYLSRRQPCG